MCSCRLHKDVHQAELRLEVALHNKQLALDEAAAAAAGQTPQVEGLILCRGGLLKDAANGAATAGQTPQTQNGATAWYISIAVDERVLVFEA